MTMTKKPQFWVEETTFHKKEKEKGKLKSFGDAWTINPSHCKLSTMSKVIYHTELRDYTISSEDAMKHMFVRNLGGETKFVIPLRYWEYDGKNPPPIKLSNAIKIDPIEEKLLF